MSTTDIAACVPDELIAQVVGLLDRAALLTWEHAEAAGTEPALHDLGLRIYLARGTAAQLLATDRHLDELDDIDDRCALELLIGAASLIGSQTVFISSVLAVEVCDLIREARALGC